MVFVSLFYGAFCGMRFALKVRMGVSVGFRVGLGLLAWRERGASLWEFFWGWVS